MAYSTFQPETRFEYTPLDPAVSSIRLITLHSDKEESEIRCDLMTYVWDPESGKVSGGGFDGAEGTSGHYQHSDQPSSNESSVQKPVNDHHLDKLQSSPLENNVQYAAISYAWGEDAIVKQILLNGRVFGVTESLWLSLRNFRLLCRRNNPPSLDLWIDAVCIDQMNLSEKSSQVENMHLVYKHADGVIVWLGVPTKDSDLAFEFMELIYADVRAKTGTAEEEPGVTLENSVLLASTEHLISSDHIQSWIALYNLLSRHWWTRSWTLQEVVMGNTVAVLCGTKVAIWPLVHLATQIASLRYQSVQRLFHSIEPRETSSHRSSATYAWPRYLSIFSIGVCTVRHFKKLLDTGRIAHSRILPQFLRASRSRFGRYQQDKIYSILGLVPPEVRRMIGRPDYELSVERVYIQMALAYMYGTQSLDIICFSDHTDTQDALLPSWTPDWRWIERLIPLQCLFSKAPSIQKWHSSSIQLCMPSFSGDATIEVSGVLISTIKETELEAKVIPQLTKNATTMGDGSRIEYAVTEWKLEGVLQELNKEARAILRCPEMNSNENAIHTLLGALLLRYSKLSEPAHELSPGTPILRGSSQGNNERDLSTMCGSIEIGTRCRTVARTDLGEFCLVPFWTEPGDVICQFVGCTIPAVLRQAERGDFKFIGECYVYQKTAEEMIRFLDKAMQSDTSTELERFRLV